MNPRRPREPARPLPRALTVTQRRAQATRPDLWPVFMAPPHLPPLPPRRSGLEEFLDEYLDEPELV